MDVCAAGRFACVEEACAVARSTAQMRSEPRRELLECVVVERRRESSYELSKQRLAELVAHGTVTGSGVVHASLLSARYAQMASCPHVM